MRGVNSQTRPKSVAWNWIETVNFSSVVKRWPLEG